MFAGKVCKQRNAERLDKHDLRRAIFLVRPVSGEVFAKARTDQWYELGRREQTMPEPRALPKKARHIAGKIVVVCGYEGRSRTSGYIQRGQAFFGVREEFHSVRESGAAWLTWVVQQKSVTAPMKARCHD